MANDSSNNNTNELSTKGLTVGNFNDPTARMISSTIARENLNNSISDEKLNAFRETVYKMCYTWEKEELVRIISEYGDSSYLKSSNPSKKELARVCTESLIVHLSQSDLQQLISDINTKERKLKGAVKSAQRSREKLAKSFFNANTIRDYGKGPAKTKKEKVSQKDDMRKLLRSVKVPKSIASRFKRLRKELEEVLRQCYNRFQLYSAAQSMDIDVTEKKDKEVINDIANKTIIYVAILTGTKATLDMAGAIGDPEPYNALLLYTSYSYLTGKPGLDPGAWRKLRENAKHAKLEMQVHARIGRKKADSHSREFLNLTGGQSRRRDIKDNDIGALSNMSDSEILELAAEYQVDVRKKDIGDIKYEIYQKMAALAKSVDKNNSRIDSAKSRGKLPGENTRILKDIYGNIDIAGRVGNTRGARDNIETGGVPIVRFDNAGQILTSAITAAVPVYVVNSTAGGLNGEGSAHAGVQAKPSKFANNFETREGFIGDLNPKEKSILNSFRIADTKFLENAYRILRTKNYVPSGTIDIIKGYSEGSSGPTDEERMRACQLYAQCNGMPNLAKYIEKYYGYRKIKLKRTFGSVVGGTAKRIGNFFGTIFQDRHFIKNFNALRRTERNRKRTGNVTSIDAMQRRSAKKATSISDLPTKFQDYYNVQYDLAIKDVMRYYDDILRNPPYNYLMNDLDEENKFKPGFGYVKDLWFGSESKKIAMDKDLAAKYAVALRAVVDGYKGLAEAMQRMFGFKLKANIFNRSKRAGIVGTAKAIRNRISNVFRYPIHKHDGTSTDANAGIINAPGIGAKPDGTDNRPAGVIAIKANGMLVKPLADGDTLFATPVYVAGALTMNLPINGKAKKEDEKSGDSKKPELESGDSKKDDSKNGIFDDLLKLSDESVTIKHNARAFSDPSKKGYNKHVARKRILKDGSASSLADVSVDIPSLQNRPSALRVIDFSRDILAQANITGGVDVSTYTVQPAIPTVLTNEQFNDIVTLTKNITNSVEDVGETISSGFSTLYKGLSTDTAIGPFIAGQIVRPGFLVGSAIETVKEAATSALVTANNMTKLGITGTLMNSGGTVSALSTPATVRKAPAITRFATGGTSAITGDAAGPNIFANGARPELVQSSGSMTVTPLNPAGSQTKQRISRMTTAERSKALSVGVSSHVVRLSYELPSGATDVSNPGEAIKVYDVKPGISDQISVGNGESTSLIAMISGIYSALTSILSTQTAGNQLLTVIGANTARSKNISNSSINQNPFAGGFPTELDGILEGE